MKPEPGIGSAVRVIVQQPKYGWGPVTPESIGEIFHISGDRAIINFPEHSHWNGLLSELEVVSRESDSDLLDLSDVSNI